MIDIDIPLLRSLCKYGHNTTLLARVSVLSVGHVDVSARGSRIQTGTLPGSLDIGCINCNWCIGCIGCIGCMRKWRQVDASAQRCSVAMTISGQR